MRLCACLPKLLPCSFRLSWLNLSKVKSEPAPQNRDHAPATRLTGVLRVESSGGPCRFLRHHLLHESAHGSDVHGVIQSGHMIVLEEPIPSLAQPGLATHFIDLQVELSLFVRWCLFHFHFSFFFRFGWL